MVGSRFFLLHFVDLILSGTTIAPLWNPGAVKYTRLHRQRNAHAYAEYPIRTPAADRPRLGHQFAARQSAGGKRPLPGAGERSVRRTPCRRWRFRRRLSAALRRLAARTGNLAGAGERHGRQPPGLAGGALPALPGAAGPNRRALGEPAGERR